jgi:hypothetical protein
VDARHVEREQILSEEEIHSLFVAKVEDSKRDESKQIE